MAAPAASVDANPAPAAGNYPTLFASYVVRSAATLQRRLAAGGAFSQEESARQRSHALHVLTFALGLDDAWPAARDLLLTLVEPMEQAGARRDWLPFLTRGVARSQALTDRSAEAELSLCIGHLLRLTSDFDAAQPWLAVALHSFRTLGDDAGAARTLNQLAYVDCLLHRPTQAQERAVAALALLPEDAAERAMSYFVLGMVAGERWQWGEAETHHRAALAIRQQQGDARRTAWAQQNVGYALQGQGRYTEAIMCLNAAAATLDGLGDAANAAIVRMNLARTYHLDGQLTLALTTGLAARQALYTVGDQLHLARLASNLGLTHLALGDANAALTVFQESVALFTDLGNVAGRLNASSGVAMAYLAAGDYAGAAAVLAPALDELAPLENVPGKAALLEAMRANLATAQAALHT